MADAPPWTKSARTPAVAAPAATQAAQASSDIPPKMPIPDTALNAEDTIPRTETSDPQYDNAAAAKAKDLITECEALTKDGRFRDAARKLREAAHITPGNPAVESALNHLREQEAKSPVVELTRKYTQSQSEADGDQVLTAVQGVALPDDVASTTAQLLLDFPLPTNADADDDEDDMLDHVTGEVLKNTGARKVLADRLVEHPTTTFDMLFDRGNDTADAVVATCVDKSAWRNEEVQIAAQRDVFQLALAQSMRAGQDHPERAMRIIAKLLAAEAGHLHGLIDADSFDVVLSSLDIRHPNSLRGQATLATAKLLELSPDTAQKVITNFVTSRVKKPNADALVMAFSAAAAIFPITPSVAATLFLTEGFMPNFVNLVQEKKSQRLDQAALELLSAACVEKTCREAISKHCRDWIQGIAQAAMDQKRSTLAALILVKISDERSVPSTKSPRTPVEEIEEPRPQDELITRFKNIVLSADHSTKQDSIEGLAYASLQPKVKEQLAKDPIFLHRLIETMSDATAWKTIMFGGLTIFVNITAYLPKQSDEEKRMSDLRAYANTSKPVAPDPLDDDAHVAARCKRVLESNIIPLLVGSIKRASPAVLSQMLQITLSLSKDPKHRGIMASQGAVKLVLQVWDTIHKEQHPVPASYSPATNHACAHTLARILISLNPSAVFGGSAAFPATNAIRPLLFLLSPDAVNSAPHPLASDTIDLLPTFEALLALTNLASMPEDPVPRDTILRLAFPLLESELLLHNNIMIRRAAVELLCNLMQSPACCRRFIPDPTPTAPTAAPPSYLSPGSGSGTSTPAVSQPGTPTRGEAPGRAKGRLHILLALSDVVDLATRRAALGALAQLTGYEGAVSGLLAHERGVSILLSAVGDSDEGVLHRGLVVLGNMLAVGGVVGAEVKTTTKAENGVEVVKEAMRRARGREVLEIGVEVLKGLVD